jgi:hypothetical protein
MSDLRAHVRRTVAAFAADMVLAYYCRYHPSMGATLRLVAEGANR